jgi:hypothetical protein
MASDAILAFRTITRCGIWRQALVGGNRVLIPIGIANPPSELTIESGDSIAKIKTKGCDGAELVAFTYAEGREPSITMNFGSATLELEALIFGRVASTVPVGTEVYAFFEFNSESGNQAARATGKLGSSVVAQVATTTKASAYYIDPVSKLSVPLSIVDSAPTGDQISIGIGLAITLSTALIEKGVNVQGWCPCVVAGTTGMTAEPIGQVTVRAAGVSFDNKARYFVANNCSRDGGGQTGSKPERTLKLLINAAPSISGLGYDIFDIPADMAC